MIDLAQPKLGSKVVFKTDDFFASAHRIINSEFIETKKQIKKIANFRLDEIIKNN